LSASASGSERRADALKQFFTQKYGIEASDLVTVGYGLKQLKGPADLFAAENRPVSTPPISRPALGPRRPIKPVVQRNQPFFFFFPPPIAERQRALTSPAFR
jgi:hypothetical protein